MWWVVRLWRDGTILISDEMVTLSEQIGKRGGSFAEGEEEQIPRCARDDKQRTRDTDGSLCRESRRPVGKSVLFAESVVPVTEAVLFAQSLSVR
jgi:hypothetical protein